METLLLNPNAPAPDSESQQTFSPVQGEGDSEFSPIFDEAVACLSQEASDDTEENSIFNIAANLTDTNMDEVSASVFFKDTSLVAENSVITEQVAFSFSNTIASSETTTQPQKVNSVVTTLDNVPTIPAQEAPLPVDQSGTENKLGAATKVENILLQQIQQILDQNSNNETITITGTRETIPGNHGAIAGLQNLSSPLVGEIENSEIQTRQVGLLVSSTEEISTATQKPAKLEGTRQEVTEQFLNARMDKSANEKGEQFQQNSGEQKGQEQQGKNNIQPTNQAPVSTVTDAQPVEAPFGQQLELNTSANTQTTGVEGKFAPGADHPVPEKEIVNNLIKRFNVNPRLQTSKLTMQLHPVELGALKINILVNNDSIKANIVAQSQQVIETLEKHMPRLKTILENQGFSVDAFEITMEGDSSKQGEFFQEQFQSQQQSEFTSSNGSPSVKTDSFDSLLNSQNESEDSAEDEAGVNVKV